MVDAPRLRTVFLRVQVDLPDGIDHRAIVEAAISVLGKAFSQFGHRNLSVSTANAVLYQRLERLVRENAALKDRIAAGESGDP